MTGTSAINKVCETFVQDRFIQVLPADDATVERWTADGLAYALEGFEVKPYDDRYDSLLQTALTQWKEREAVVMRSLDISGAVFDRWFPKIVQTFHRQSGEVRYLGRPLGRALLNSSELVRNMDWVRTFVCFVPRHVQQDRPLFLEVGLRMASIFYLEMMDKWIQRNEADLKQDLSGFTRIDAYWKYALKQQRSAKIF